MRLRRAKKFPEPPLPLLFRCHRCDKHVENVKTLRWDGIGHVCPDCHCPDCGPETKEARPDDRR